MFSSFELIKSLFFFYIPCRPFGLTSTGHAATEDALKGTGKIKQGNKYSRKMKKKEGTLGQQHKRQRTTVISLIRKLERMRQALLYLDVPKKKARFCTGLSTAAERRETELGEIMLVKKASY